MNYPTLRLFDGYEHTAIWLRPDVQRLQSALNEHGESLKVDGLFGRTTERAVLDFQGRHGLTTDGIVGPQTWGALTSEAIDAGLFPTDYPRESGELRAQLAASLRWIEHIQEGAIRASVPVAVVWGIGSRESHWGLYLKPRGPAGTGDHGHGRGLMQIDDRWHPSFTGGDQWKDPAENIAYGCEVLRDNVRMFRAVLGSEDGLRAAVAAYNCGPGNVRTALKRGFGVDAFTTGRNYSDDVLRRAGWFQLQKENG